MHVSKCMFCRTGIVLDKEDCGKVIGHVWCDIDAYTEGFTNCTPDGCYYYEKQSEKKESEAAQ